MAHHQPAVGAYGQFDGGALAMEGGREGLQGGFDVEGPARGLVRGSFDAGYGSALLARQIGQKAAREIFFLAREYSAEDMVRMGAVNEAVDHERLEDVALEYAADIARQSPQAIRMLKFAFNLADDGLAGQQVFAGEATRMAYMTDEAVEGKEAFLEKREPDWSRFPYYF